MFASVYQGKKVLITGHTGFKGSFLALWLQSLGCELCGIALEPETVPAHWSLLDLKMRSEICDIRDAAKVEAVINSFQPEIVFHLAAQPIVRTSYLIPRETFEVNIMGTVNILDICRRSDSVHSIVVVTSDKCYENVEKSAGYKESDPMGGYDPYSASKGCAELVANSFARSFFNPAEYGRKHHTLLATARAGNVIGGGDWAADRLVPDIMKAAAAGIPARIRNPHATRPFQHVLEPLSGYLLLGAKLCQGDTGAAGAWNFGPDNDGIIDVGTAAKMLSKQWSNINFTIDPPPDQPHEATLLHLDCTKAAEKLHWHGVLANEEMFRFTADWYKAFYQENKVISRQQLDEYISLAEKRDLSWIK
jgi:CDP-glucose 4,6-dehydratase